MRGYNGISEHEEPVTFAQERVNIPVSESRVKKLCNMLVGQDK